jgi:CO/xanthine dehydrogenase Mo-binding subunit
MALEGQMNIAAAELKIDPVEIRLRNLARKGEEFIPHERAADGDWPSLVTKAAQAVGWHKNKRRGVGRGLAFGMKASKAATLSNARVILHHDCSATVLIGTTEMGQGTRTVMARVVGNSLGIPLDRVSLYLGDTATVPFDTLTAASRSVVSMGNALVAACEQILEQLRKIVADAHGLGVGSFNLKAGTLTTDEGSVLAVEDILRTGLGSYMGEIIGDGSSQGLRSADNPLGGPAPFFEAVVTAVELEVDDETGQVDIHKIVHVSDAGKAINPQRSAGVDEGGNVMGLGLALSEQIFYGSSGQLLNSSSLDYRIPTILDAPGQLDSILQENRDGPGPQGAKGLGEGGILAVTPAVCAAVFDATGIFFCELPITPERLWHALQHKGDG